MSAQEGPPPPNENAGPTILGVTVGMTLLASVVSFALRLYVRSRMIRKIGWDVSPQRAFLSITMA